MKYKVILFDVDGVIVNPPIISETLENYYNLPFSKTKEFFKTEFIQCSIGKSDLKVAIYPYLDKWNWTQGVDEFVKIWMETSSGVNSIFLSMVKSLKSYNIHCYLSTNQERIRTEYLMNEMRLNDYFDGIFSSSMCGFLKPSNDYFDWILYEINKKDFYIKSDLLLIDDSAKNVEAAIEYGIDAILFENRNYEYISSKILAI